MGYNYDDEDPTQLPPAASNPGSGYPSYPDGEEAPTNLQYGGYSQPAQPPRPGSRPAPPPAADDETRLPDRLRQTRRPNRRPEERPDSRGGFEDDHTVIDAGERVSATEPIGYFFIKEPMQRFGRYFLIRGNMMIGRAAHHPLSLNDPLVSEPHGRVKLERDPDTKAPVFALYDFGSNNGTYVNDERVMGTVILQENDVIRIGKHVFVFKMLP